jgi:hypothetical protein
MKLPQLTLRDLFWLVLVVAMALGWLIDRDQLRVDYNGNLNLVNHARRRVDELRRAIEGQGYIAQWDEKLNGYRLTKGE